MKKEAIAHGVLEDLANRNDNWDKLDGVINQVNGLDESRLILKNEIVNGDFSDGTTGWVGNGNTLQSVDNTLLVTVVTPAVATSHYIRQDLQAEANQKYYIKYSVKPKFSKIIRFYFGGKYLDYNTSPIANGWNHYSGIIETTTKPTSALQMITHDTSALYSIGDVWEVKDVSNVNLTQTFGAGNEPTKEEMDIIMDTIGYFNGSHTITSKEQFNILLKMVRENALATTSLGGGF